MDRRREDEIGAFLAASGWAAARREPLAADASFRRYDRLSLRDRRAVLMDAPPDREDVRPFLRIARLLRAGGFSAPAILAADAKNGFALLEDFGDRTFTRLLDGGADPADLYALAVDVLIRLHGRTAPADVPRYTDDLLLEEAGHFTGWYLPAATGQPVPDAAADEYLQIWRALLPDARRVPEALALRSDGGTSRRGGGVHPIGVDSGNENFRPPHVRQRARPAISRSARISAAGVPT